MVNAVSATAFDVELERWAPQIQRYANLPVPYHSSEDLEQELSLTLWKCLQFFDSERGIKFHTYLVTAFKRRISTLIVTVRRHNPCGWPLQDPVSRRFTPLQMPISCGLFRGANDEPFEPSVEFDVVMGLEVEMWGLRGVEADYALDKVDHLTHAEMSRRRGRSVRDLKRVAGRVRVQMSTVMEAA